MKAHIVVIPGDGIGQETVTEACRVLEAIAGLYNHDISFEEHLIGGRAMAEGLPPLPAATLKASLASNGVLLGAVGDEQFEDIGSPLRPEQGTLDLRAALGVYANLRPVRVTPGLENITPLKPEKIRGVDLVVIRELTGGLHYGRPSYRKFVGGERRAIDTLAYTETEIRRVVRSAFRLASDRRCLVTSVDKANILESSRLWRQIAEEVATEFPHVQLEHRYIDATAMQLLQNPASFDVIVTENMFGDILSEEAALIVGSLGMMPSASIGDGPVKLYEPIHGSAPDIAGQGIANPAGTILSAAMLLEYSLGLKTEARACESAVAGAIASGVRTTDLGTDQPVSTREFGDAVLQELYQHRKR